MFSSLLATGTLETKLDDLSKNLNILKIRLSGLSYKLSDLKDSLDGKDISTLLLSDVVIKKIKSVVSDGDICDFIFDKNKDSLIFF